MSTEQQLLDQIFVVLCDTSHPGNIGASARAMKTMGINRLCLVNPRSWPHPEATARAAGATDVLDTATVVDQLATAIAPASYVIGMSARSRDLGPPQMQARAAAMHLIEWLATNNNTPALNDNSNIGTHSPSSTTSETSPATSETSPAASEITNAPQIALVFGNETSGLSNKQLQLCHETVAIPSVAGFSSLNLGAAVQIMTYECRMAAFAGVPPAIGFATPKTSPAAKHAETEHLLRHIESVMAVSGFWNPQQPKRLIEKMQRIIMRSQLSQEEVQLLRGLLAAIDQYLPYQK